MVPLDGSVKIIFFFSFNKTSTVRKVITNCSFTLRLFLISSVFFFKQWTFRRIFNPIFFLVEFCFIYNHAVVVWIFKSIENEYKFQRNYWMYEKSLETRTCPLSNMSFHSKTKSPYQWVLTSNFNFNYC